MKAITKELFETLHIAEMVIRADFNTRIQQPVARHANETVIEVISDTLKKARKAGLVCDCPDHT